MARLVVALAFASMVLVWGPTWLVIRVGLEAYPPFFSLAARFGIAGPLLLLVMRLRGQKIPWEPRHQPLFLTITLCTFVISFGVVYWAEQYLSSGLTAVIFALLPLFTGFAAHFMLHDDRLRPSRLAGLAVGLLGIVVINLSDLGQIHPRAPLAAGVLVASPIVVAISSVLSKKHLHEYPLLAFSALPVTYGAVVHGLLWLALERDVPVGWSWKGAAAITYLAIFGSMITFASYYWLLQRVPVSRLNLTAYLTPIIALAAGTLLGGEILTPRMLAGAGLVFAGVAIAGIPTSRLPGWGAAARIRGAP